MKNIILFGPPGSGKGTQSERIEKIHRFITISTGNLFRENIVNRTDVGLLAKSFIDKGQLVPDQVTLSMLEQELEKLTENTDIQGIIFDGFPRNQEQAIALDEVVSKRSETIDALISLEVDKNTLVSRILERGKTSNRSDDLDTSVINARLQVYENETAILKEFYQEKGKLHRINGIGSIEQITKAISKVISQL